MNTDDDDVVTEQKLREIFYDPLVGYRSVKDLYQKMNDDGHEVTMAFVKNWVKTQDTYTKHKPLVKKFKRRRTIVKDLAVQVQMDLVDMKKYKAQNDDFVWILTATEILSKFSFAIPVLRKDTTNMTQAVGTLLTLFKTRFGKLPKVAQFDEGLEFLNVGVMTLLKTNDIEIWQTHTGKKAAIVERFNRTLKTMMWKYFYANETHRWVDVLDSLVSNYNSQVHSTINMKPVDVTDKNKSFAWVAQYGYLDAYAELPKFKLDDLVRVSTYRIPSKKLEFKKGYEAGFPDEVFKITQVNRGYPNTYKLMSEGNEPIIGMFYEQELSEVVPSKREFKVEKVLGRKTERGVKMVYVKWVGLNEKHNTWIQKSLIKEDVGK